MQIKIYHLYRNDENDAGSGVYFLPVARVKVPDGMEVEEALEAAYAATQNIEGSWSAGERLFMGEPNPDYSPAVTRLGSFPEYLGRTYGIRSTSVNDLMEIEPHGEFWAVDGCGFSRKENLDKAA